MGDVFVSGRGGRRKWKLILETRHGTTLAAHCGVDRLRVGCAVARPRRLEVSSNIRIVTYTKRYGRRVKRGTRIGCLHREEKLKHTERQSVS